MEHDGFGTGVFKSGLHRGKQDLAAADAVLFRVQGAHHRTDALADKEDIVILLPVDLPQGFLRLLHGDLYAQALLFRIIPDLVRKTGIGNREDLPSEFLEQFPAVIEQGLVAGIADAGE